MKANPVVNIVSLHPFQMTDRWLLQLVLRLQHKIDQDSQISIKSSNMNHNDSSNNNRAPKFKWFDAPKKWSFEQTCSSSVERNSENIRSHMNIFLTLDSFFGLDVRVHSYFCINRILPTSFILYFHQTFCWHKLQIMTHKSQQLRMKIQPRRHSSSRAKHLHGIVR